MQRPEYTAEEEAALIARVRQDPQGFRVLYRRYHPRIFAYVAYRVGRAEDAEDIVADIFTRAVEKLHQFEHRGEGAFSAWLFRIASNEVNRHYWRHGRRPEPLSLDAVPEIGSDDLPPEIAYARKEQFEQLRQAITRLSPRRQEIITLKFFGELRNQEIAIVLGLDERTIAPHLCRALEDLQRIYSDENHATERLRNLRSD